MSPKDDLQSSPAISELRRKTFDLTVKHLTVFWPKCQLVTVTTFHKNVTESLLTCPLTIETVVVRPYWRFDQRIRNWCDCEWEGDRLKLYLKSKYQDFICHIRLTCSRPKIYFDRENWTSNSFCFFFCCVLHAIISTSVIIYFLRGFLTLTNTFCDHT